MTYDPSSAPYAILVALTFDQTGVNALREATRIAELHPTSQLHVLHVVSEIGTASSGRELLSAERRLARAPDVMRQYVEHVWSNLPRKVIGHLRVGVPARSIVQTAADINAELVVVGTHRRSGMKRLVQGSVAAQVVAKAHCPVFIAMPKDYSQTTSQDAAGAAAEPCPRCADVRRQSGGEYLWCPEHGRPNVKPLVYRPTKARGAATPPPPPPRERAR